MGAKGLGLGAWLGGHPLSVAELGVDDDAGLRRLLDLGGFPEPWVGDSLEAVRRWSREYRMRLVERRRSATSRASPTSARSSCSRSG